MKPGLPGFHNKTHPIAPQNYPKTSPVTFRGGSHFKNRPWQQCFSSPVMRETADLATLSEMVSVWYWVNISWVWRLLSQSDSRNIVLYKMLYIIYITFPFKGLKQSDMKYKLKSLKRVKEEKVCFETEGRRESERGLYLFLGAWSILCYFRTLHLHLSSYLLFHSEQLHVLFCYRPGQASFSSHRRKESDSRSPFFSQSLIKGRVKLLHTLSAVHPFHRQKPSHLKRY